MSRHDAHLSTSRKREDGSDHSEHGPDRTEFPHVPCRSRSMALPITVEYRLGHANALGVARCPRNGPDEISLPAWHCPAHARSMLDRKPVHSCITHRCACRRQAHHHDRTILTQPPQKDFAGLDQARHAAMPLLSIQPDHVGRCALHRQAEAKQRRHQRRDAENVCHCRPMRASTRESSARRVVNEQQRGDLTSFPIGFYDIIEGDSIPISPSTASWCEHHGQQRSPHRLQRQVLQFGPLMQPSTRRPTMQPQHLRPRRGANGQSV